MTDFKVGDRVRFRERFRLTHSEVTLNPLPPFDTVCTITAVRAWHGDGIQTQLVEVAEYNTSLGGEWFESAE